MILILVESEPRSLASTAYFCSSTSSTLVLLELIHNAYMYVAHPIFHALQTMPSSTALN